MKNYLTPNWIAYNKQSFNEFYSNKYLQLKRPIDKTYALSKLNQNNKESLNIPTIPSQ